MELNFYHFMTCLSLCKFFISHIMSAHILALSISLCFRLFCILHFTFSPDNAFLFLLPLVLFCYAHHLHTSQKSSKLFVIVELFIHNLSSLQKNTFPLKKKKNENFFKGELSIKIEIWHYLLTLTTTFCLVYTFTFTLTIYF